MSTAEVPAAQPIAPDHSDSNSEIADTDAQTTESIRSTILESLRENGRSYHKYRSDLAYIAPDDQREQDRLDLQHELFLKTFSNKLNLAPLGNEISNVLDIGTGTGIWAIDFADAHPKSNVIGTDLSPIQPSWVPTNCKFEVDDFDKEWTWAKKFDYIHWRMVSPWSADFPTLIKRCFDALEDGGWIEMQDVYLPFLSDDGTLDNTNFGRWNELFVEACQKTGRDCKWPTKFGNLLTETGFVDVSEKIFKWPINSWPKDPHMKTIGEWNLVNMLEGLEGFTFRLFTGALGWTMQEIEVFLSKVRQDLHNKKMHSYLRVHVIYAQRPSSSKTQQV